MAAVSKAKPNQGSKDLTAGREKHGQNLMGAGEMKKAKRPKAAKKGKKAKSAC